MRVAALLLVPATAVSADATAGALAISDLDPALARAARSAVAILVDREPEPPSRRRFPLARRSRLPADVVDYDRRPEGPATGLLLDSQGHVLTTHYNVAGTVKGFQVVLGDGTRLPARLISTAPGDDLALLKLVDPPPDLEAPPIAWAAEEKLRVGRVVVALGRTPDPRRPTATFGIISATTRNGGRAFQTDAELNYGNVGGPLVDLEGRVLGLASFVGHSFPLWGLNSGIGFGTSAATIRSVLPQLIRGESVKPPPRPFMGVGPAERSPPDGAGVVIGQVEPGSAAAEAGLKEDDVVLSLEGVELEDFLDLRREINRRRPGDEVKLKVRRGETDLELKVRLGTRKD